MIPLRCTLFGLTAALFLSTGTLGDEAKVRTIHVSGEAAVKVVPDEIVLTVGVDTFDPSLERARQENDKRATAILSYARAAGVPDDQIQTEYIHAQPDWETPGQWDVKGYRVRKNIAVILSDVARFEEILAGVLDAGATNVHKIDFRTTELRKYRDQARKLALEAAREKAADMAGVLGLTLGLPTNIQEQHSGWFSAYNAWSWWGGSYQYASQNAVQLVGDGAAAGESVALGRISVTAQVQVTFEVTPKDAAR